MHSHRALKYSAYDWARRLYQVILDTVFPPRCLVCRCIFKPGATETGAEYPTKAKTDIIDLFPEYNPLQTSYCCPECISTFTAVSAPFCNCCGMMFKSRQGENHFCGDCITQPKKFRIARAAVANNPQLMTAIHRFKYAGKLQLADLLGGLMLNAYRKFWESEKFDLVLPVPLHAKKLRKRGFNQSYLLIHSWKTISIPLAVELSAIPVSTDVLIKKKATIPQTGLGRQQRLINIRGAFRVQAVILPFSSKNSWTDPRIFTGATVNECARMLLKAGAAFVDVLTVARAM